VPLPLPDAAGPYGETCGSEEGPLDVLDPDAVRDDPLPDGLPLPERGTVTVEGPPVLSAGTVIVSGCGDMPAPEGPKAVPLG
jgi:hypothetical protein